MRSELSFAVLGTACPACAVTGAENAGLSGCGVVSGTDPDGWLTHLAGPFEVPGLVFEGVVTRSDGCRTD